MIPKDGSAIRDHCSEVVIRVGKKVIENVLSKNARCANYYDSFCIENAGCSVGLGIFFLSGGACRWEDSICVIGAPVCYAERVVEEKTVALCSLLSRFLLSIQ